MHIKSYLYCLCITLIVCTNAVAQQFKKGDRICFVGNSITHNGDYWHNIQLYYTTRFPQLGLQFFNCGISGDVAGGILKRMDSDILIHKPTWCVLMIGMNDVNRGLYDPKRKDGPGIKEKQQAALVTYKKNIDSILRIFEEQKIKVILQTPSIYDQTSKMAGTNLFGVNDALGVCADYIKAKAQEYKLTVVDYWTRLSALNKEFQLTDSTGTLISKDRVHPAGPGHLLMAWEFLRTTKAPSIVSTIVINQDTATSRKASQRCTISNFERKGDKVSFTCTEQALPFPMRDDQRLVADLVAFDMDVNRQTLQINYLKPGNYSLTIDGVEMGKYFSGDLERGILISELPNLPQYRQSRDVQGLLQRSWAIEAQLRNLKLIEHRYINNLPGKENLEVVRRFYDSAHSAKPETDGARKLFVAYLENKPKEAELEERFNRSLDSLPILNKPAPHKYVLTRLR